MMSKETSRLTRPQTVEQKRWKPKWCQRRRMGQMKPKESPIAKPGSWEEAAAAAGVTLVEHSEGLEPALVETKKKRRSLKEMRTAPVRQKESSAKITDSEKKMF